MIDKSTQIVCDKNRNHCIRIFKAKVAIDLNATKRFLKDY
mgnify:FL=1